MTSSPFHPLQQRCTITNTMSSFRLTLIMSQHGLLLRGGGGGSPHNGLIHSSSKDEWVSQGVYYVSERGREGWNNFSPCFAWKTMQEGAMCSQLLLNRHISLMVTFKSSLSAELSYLVWPWSTQLVLHEDLPSAPGWCDLAPGAKSVTISAGRSPAQMHRF